MEPSYQEYRSISQPDRDVSLLDGKETIMEGEDSIQQQEQQLIYNPCWSIVYSNTT